MKSTGARSSNELQWLDLNIGHRDSSDKPYWLYRVLCPLRWLTRLTNDINLVSSHTETSAAAGNIQGISSPCSLGRSISHRRRRTAGWQRRRQQLSNTRCSAVAAVTWAGHARQCVHMAVPCQGWSRVRCPGLCAWSVIFPCWIIYWQRKLVGCSVLHGECSRVVL